MSHFSVAVIMNYYSTVNEMLAPYQKNNMGNCPKEFLKFYEDEKCKVDTETGKRGYWANPNRKWDRWTIGGRYNGFFKKKNGERCDYCEIGELDLTPDENQVREAERFWEVMVEGLPKKPGEQINNFYKPEYYIDLYGDKNNFVNAKSGFYPFAFVTPDKIWHEQGEIMWGIIFTTRESIEAYISEWKKAIARAYPDNLVVIVDCHI